ncbi:hypothetical protein Tco_0494455 [Tanacetum coccineum]
MDRARSQVRVLVRAIGVSSQVRKGKGALPYVAGPTWLCGLATLWDRGHVATNCPETTYPQVLVAEVYISAEENGTLGGHFSNSSPPSEGVAVDFVRNFGKFFWSDSTLVVLVELMHELRTGRSAQGHSKSREYSE